MLQSHRTCLSFLISLCVLIASIAQASALAAASVSSVSGNLTSLHGDDFAESRYEIRYTLTKGDGSELALDIDEKVVRSAGGNLAFDGRFVTVEYTGSDQARDGQLLPLKVLSIRNAGKGVSEKTKPDVRSDTRAAVSGSRPWISVLCKFSDVADEPKDLAYFKEMYSSTYPGLDHYWREVSFDTVNILGSDAVGWFTLPHAEAYYNPTGTNGGTDLSLLREDCLAAADAVVDYTQFEGINMMFNTNIDGYAWGGRAYLTLDGESRLWRVTWEPPWGYSSITVIAHEMGHGFGLPHSSGTYGATYDNVWDVMSDTWANCQLSSDATYGCLGQHTIAYHKDILGWITEGQKVVAQANSAVTIDHIALASGTNARMIQIPIVDSPTRFYTVEVRNLEGYDVKLPGKAVVIHEVDTSRSRPANVIDTDGNGDTGDAGAMLLTGETFSDVDNAIYIRVLSETATGFVVSVAFSQEAGIYKRLIDMLTLMLVE